MIEVRNLIFIHANCIFNTVYHLLLTRKEISKYNIIKIININIKGKPGKVKC